MRGVLALLAVCTACGRIDFFERNLADSGSGDADASSTCTLGPFSVPVPVAGINSVSDDWSISLTDDEQVAFMASWRGGSSQIWTATRADRTSPFDPPTLVTEVMGDGTDQSPMISADGLYLIVPSNRTGSMGSYDFFAFTRPDRTTAFVPGPSLAAVNSVSNESRSWVSNDGLRIYFSSARLGTDDIFIAERTSTSQPFGTAMPIAELDTSANEFGPALSDEELEVFFTSTRAGGLGNEDIWYATRAATNQPFGAPQNLGVVNSTRDDVSPWLSGDGKSLYLNHDALELGGANADIWVSARGCL